MPPSIWLTSAVGIDDEARVHGRHRFRHAHLAGAAVHVDIGDHRDVAREVLVLREREAAPARAVAFLPRLPARFLRARFDHRARARVLHVPQPELDRVGAGGDRQLVHERLEREHVGVGAERAQRRGADRHVGDVVQHDLLARKLVDRHGVAIGAARGLRSIGRRVPSDRVRDVPAREQIAAGVADRARAVRMAPHVVLPVHDAARDSSSRARIFITIAEPYGSQPNSSSRIHCSLTGRPPVARATSTASSATSSAPLCP